MVRFAPRRLRVGPGQPRLESARVLPRHNFGPGKCASRGGCQDMAGLSGRGSVGVGAGVSWGKVWLHLKTLGEVEQAVGWMLDAFLFLWPSPQASQ